MTNATSTCDCPPECADWLGRGAAHARLARQRPWRSGGSRLGSVGLIVDKRGCSKVAGSVWHLSRLVSNKFSGLVGLVAGALCPRCLACSTYRITPAILNLDKEKEADEISHSHISLRARVVRLAHQRVPHPPRPCAHRPRFSSSSGFLYWLALSGGGHTAVVSPREVKQVLSWGIQVLALS